MLPVLSVKQEGLGARTFGSLEGRAEGWDSWVFGSKG